MRSSERSERPCWVCYPRHTHGVPKKTNGIHLKFDNWIFSEMVGWLWLSLWTSLLASLHLCQSAVANAGPFPLHPSVDDVPVAKEYWFETDWEAFLFSGVHILVANCFERGCTLVTGYFGSPPRDVRQHTYDEYLCVNIFFFFPPPFLLLRLSSQSITEYNGAAMCAMVGKNCVAIASDTRLGIQVRTA